MSGEKSFPMYFVRRWGKTILFVVSSNLGVLTLVKANCMSRNEVLRFFFWMKLLYICNQGTDTIDSAGLVSKSKDIWGGLGSSVPTSEKF